MTDSVSPVGVSDERLNKMLAAIPRYPDGKVRSSGWVGRVPAPELEALLTELLSRRSLDRDGEVPHFDRTRCATEGCGKVATEYFERGGVGSYHCDECADKIKALSRPTRNAEAGVKALEWGDCAINHWKGFNIPSNHGLAVAYAETTIGTYAIVKGSQGRFEAWLSDGQVSGSYATKDEAKAAAQADFDRRILSYLKAGEDEPGAWVPRMDAIIAVAKDMAEILLGKRPTDEQKERAARFLFSCIDRGALSPLAAHPSRSVTAEVTEEMVERAARAMEPMAFREEFTATDEWYELEQEGRTQALGRARSALIAAFQPSKGG